MAWRSYRDPTDNQIWWTDDAGNFIPDAQWQKENPMAQPNASVANTPFGEKGYDYAGYLRAIAQSNQKQFDAMMDIEGKKLGLSQQEIDERKRQFNLSLYSNMAQSLLAGAASLRGPEDWLSYAQYTSGGRDIFKQLFGNEAAPAFGAPTGYSEPSSVTSILKALGIPSMGGVGDGGAGASMTDDQALDAIWAARPDLKNFYASNGWDVSTPVAQRAAVRNWITQGDPQWKGMTPQQVAGKLGAGAPPAGASPGAPSASVGVPGGGRYQPVERPSQIMPLPSPGQGLPPIEQPIQMPGLPGWGYQHLPSPGQGLPPIEQPIQMPGLPKGPVPVTPPSLPDTGASAVSTGPMAPLPHQINPGVWDALSPTAKKMILGAVAKGRTPSGAWDPEDYLRQLNASRPMGTAPRSVRTQWGMPRSAY